MKLNYSVAYLYYIAIVSISTGVFFPNFSVGSSQTPTKNKFDYIIFGKFCEECFSNDCTIMYKLDINKNKLYVDHTNSFYNIPWGTQMQFTKEVKTDIDIERVRQILDSIPQILLEAKEDWTFGHPDQGDQCGLFFLTKTDMTVRKFLIDYNLATLEDSIKAFAICLKRKITEL
jgi:hypothetical protein